MKRQSVVYLICGFIGAGKTTFAKKLEEKSGAVRITKDEWSIRIIGSDPAIDGYAEWDQKSSGYHGILHFISQGKELMSLWMRDSGGGENEKS